MTPDTDCGCPGAHWLYAITDDHGVRQTASLCGECAAYADAEWTASGSTVRIVSREAQADCALVLETLIERLRVDEDERGYVCVSDARGHRVRLSPDQGRVVEQGREALGILADRREALVRSLLSLPEGGAR